MARKPVSVVIAVPHNILKVILYGMYVRKYE